VLVEVEPVLGGNLKQLVRKARGTVMSTSTQKITGTTWQPVTVTARPSGSLPVVWTEGFTVEPGPTGIDLDLVPNGQTGGGVSAPVPPVTSANGQSGAVEIPEGEPLTPEAGEAKLRECLTRATLSAAFVERPYRWAYPHLEAEPAGQFPRPLIQ
jgi:hypothetical protein